jgi:hypothetical protein
MRAFPSIARVPAKVSSRFSLLARSLLSPAGRGCPAASNFLLLRQKKVTKEKATRSLGPCASLRATCGARLRRGLAQTRLRLKQARSLIRLRLRSSAQPGRGNRERGQKTGIPTRQLQTRTRQGVSLWYFRYSAVGYWSFPHPLWMRRGAQGQTDQGSRCLSEAQRSEFSETPSGPSTAGCPQRSVGTQQPGSPFLLLTFLLAKQKKSELPPGNPRPTALSKEHTRRSNGFDKLSPNG